jgi:outer membrane protein assembly factor BamA
MNNVELLDDFTYGTYGLGELNPLGLHGGFEIDKRNNPVMPSSGFYADIHGAVFPKIFDIDETFYRAGGDVRAYLPFSIFNGATLALRTGGEKVWGKYPFYAAAFLGGIENLRGYNRWRFSGDASVFGQAEARIWLTRMKVLLKSKFGINLFAETGRVFVEGDIQDSDKWHPSYGGGFWLSYLEDNIVVSTYIAVSPDRLTFSFGFAMAY